MAIGGLPEVKQTIIDMRLNASGVHDTARSLHICTNIVLRELKKKAPMLESVHPSLLHTLNPTEVTWDPRTRWRSGDGCEVVVCREQR